MDSLSKVRDLYQRVLVRQAEAQRRDIEEILAGEQVDAIVSDSLMLGAGIAAARSGVPWATIGDGPLLWSDASTPPFGAGLPPMDGVAGRHRNATVRRIVHGWLFAEALDELNALRRTLGLPPVSCLQSAGLSSQLHLQGCTPAFEYPRTSLPQSIHFVGALGPGSGFAPPVPTHLQRENRTRRLAFITQGTLRRNLDELAVPAVRALDADRWDILVAAGGGTPDRLHHLRNLGSHVSVVDSVDYHAALRESDLFVTNGGYTGVTLALAAGVPVLQAGATEEKADIGARLKWAGVGASVRRTRPSVAQLRHAARKLMESSARRRASRDLALEMSTYDAAELGAGLVGQLVGVQQR